VADGRVVIEIDADSSKFSAAVGKLGDTAKQGLGTAIKGSFIGNLFANAFSKAAGVISSSLDGAISRVDTLNQFPRVMSQLGYGADSASAAIGKMSDHIQGLPTKLDSIAGSVQRVVPKFKDVGKATDVMLALNDALVAGGQSSQVQEAALEQYVQGISKGKFELEEWRSIQTAMPGQLDAVAQSMLGAGKSSNDLYEALKSGKVSVDDFADAFVRLDSEGINGMASFAEQAKTGSAGIATSMSNAANAVTVQIAKIIDKINENGEIAAGFDAIKQAVTEFGGAAVTAVGWVKDNFGTIAPIVAAVGAAFTALQIVPAIMPAVGAVQSLVSVVRSVGAASVAIKVLGSAVAAVGGPVTIVIAAIAALVAVFATLYATNQDFANAVNGAWAQIQAAFTAIQPSLQALGEQFMALGEAIMPALTQIGTLILDLATTLIGALAPVIQQIVEAVTAAMPTITAAIQFVANVLAVIIGVVVQVVSAFVSFGQTLVSAAQSAADFVSNVGSFLSGLPGVIWGFLTGALSNVDNFVGQMASNAASAGQQFLSNIGGALGGLAGRVGGFLGSTIGQAASFVGQMASKASQAGQQFMSNIVSTLSGIPGRVASIGEQIVSGIANGIRGAAGAVVSALGGVVNQAVEHAKSMLGIHSPSRVMRNLIGKNIARGVAVGIEDETATAVAAVRAMSAQVVEAGNASMEIPPIEVQKAVAVMDSTTQESVFGDSFMQGVQAITERLDLIYAKLDEIKQAIQEDREVRIDKREFARLVREV
jgi:tape measure domain-containing protein